MLLNSVLLVVIICCGVFGVTISTIAQISTAETSVILNAALEPSAQQQTTFSQNPGRVENGATPTQPLEHEATQEDRCSGLITQGSYFGIISTPNYPAPYDNNETCLWSIQVRQGYYLRVSFKEFHLEEGLSVQGGLCAFDYLRLFEVYRVRTNFLPRQGSQSVILKRNWGTYCGTRSPPDLTISLPGSTLHLLFHTDATKTEKGFFCTFEHVRNARMSDGILMNNTVWNGGQEEADKSGLSVNYLLFAFLLIFLGVTAVAAVAYRIVVSRIVQSLGAFSDRLTDHDAGPILYDAETGTFTNRSQNYGNDGSNRIPTPPPAYGDIVKTEEDWNRVVQQLGEASASALRQHWDADSIEVTYDLRDDIMTTAAVPSTRPASNDTSSMSSDTLRVSSSEDRSLSGSSSERSIVRGSSVVSSVCDRVPFHLPASSAPELHVTSEIGRQSASEPEVTVSVESLPRFYDYDAGQVTAEEENGERQLSCRTSPIFRVMFRGHL